MRLKKVTTNNVIKDATLTEITKCRKCWIMFRRKDSCAYFKIGYCLIYILQFK